MIGCVYKIIISPAVTFTAEVIRIYIHIDGKNGDKNCKYQTLCARRIFRLSRYRLRAFRRKKKSICTHAYIYIFFFAYDSRKCISAKKRVDRTRERVVATVALLAAGFTRPPHPPITAFIIAASFIERALH
jgi:hypothetical protein